MDWTLVVILCVAGAFLGRFQTNARIGAKLDPISKFICDTVEPLASVLTVAANAGSDFTSGIAGISGLKAENRRLKDLAQSAALYNENVDRLLKDNDRLRKMLELPPVPGRSRIAGTVTGYSPLENRITIGLGSGAGIREGMPVVTAEGLAGVVQTVDAGSCQALLVTSPRLRIGAMVQRDPPPSGLIIGQSSRSLLLDYLDIQSTVQVGDLVVTSSHSDRYPPGIPIGIVTQVMDDPEYGSRRCLVFPKVQVGSLRDVYILR